MNTSICDLSETEYLLPGNRTCSGCGLSIAFRSILRALEGKGVVVVPASCLTVLGGMYPHSSVLVPWLNVSFPSVASSASGVVAGLRAKGRADEITVVAIAGDGGTNDIGIQALSGAAERRTDFIYICYDNEAYMNTGTQRSSSTPLGAKTTTTPVLGKRQHSKDMPSIMESHGLPYVAVSSAASPVDVYEKVRRARARRGCTRYLHISTPCPPGWGFPTKDTVNVGRMAIETGLVVLYEVDDGEFRLTGESKTLAESGGKLAPIRDYIKAQRRFRGITDETIEEIQDWLQERWEHCLERAAEGASG